MLEEREQALRNNFIFVILNMLSCELIMKCLHSGAFNSVFGFLAKVQQKLFRGGNDDAPGLDDLGAEALEAADPTALNTMVGAPPPPAGLESAVSSSMTTASTSGGAGAGGGQASAVVSLAGMNLLKDKLV